MIVDRSLKITRAAADLFESFAAPALYLWILVSIDRFSQSTHTHTHTQSPPYFVDANRSGALQLAGQQTDYPRFRPAVGISLPMAMDGGTDHRCKSNVVFLGGHHVMSCSLEQSSFIIQP